MIILCQLKMICLFFDNCIKIIVSFLFGGLSVHLVLEAFPCQDVNLVYESKTNCRVLSLLDKPTVNKVENTGLSYAAGRG